MSKKSIGRKKAAAGHSFKARGSRPNSSSGLNSFLDVETIPLVAAAAGASSLAYLLVPMLVNPVVALSMMLWRGVLSGAVAGLTLERKAPIWLAPATAALGSCVGLVVLSIAGGSARFEPVGVVTAAMAATLMFLLMRRVGTQWAQLTALALALVAMLFFTGTVGGPFREGPGVERRAELSKQPEPGKYAFDGGVYLRTRHLMKQGKPYYQSFRQAIDGDARLDSANMKSAFNYREPFLFYVWKALPGPLPIHLLYWFVVFGSLTMVASYLLASTFVGPGPALLAPLGMMHLVFYFYWAGSWFTMAELWSSFLSVIALLALVRGRSLSSIVLLTAAVAMRELTIVLVPVWLCVWWLTTPRENRMSILWIPLACVVVPTAVIGVHVAMAPAMASSGGVGSLSAWFHGGQARMIDAIRFGWDFLPVPKVLALVISALAVAGTLSLPSRMMRVSMSVALLVPLLFLLVLSSGETGYYWGAFYTPVAVALMPTIFSRAVPPKIPVA